MTSPASTDLGERLGRVVGASVIAADELKNALAEEHNALERRDTESLSQAIERKQAQLGRLAALERERMQLCLDAGVGSSPEEMSDVASGCAGGPALLDSWQRFRAIAADCDAMNLANGAIIRIRQKQTADGLALLRGANPTSDTYGPGGVTAAQDGGRALAEA